MTNGTINNKTKISVALVGMMAVPVLGFVATFATLKTEQTTIKEKVEHIASDYVPRDELQIQIKSIVEDIREVKDGQQQILDILTK